MSGAHAAEAVPGLSVTDGVVTAALSSCVALLAAALIVLSLIELRGAQLGAAYSLSAALQRRNALSTVLFVRLTVWSSGLGAVAGFVALVWARAVPRWIAVALALVAIMSFIAMAVRTVGTVVTSSEGSD